MDKVSIIIPVYNVRPYIERCLDSVLKQTYTNLEIICVDDGSYDGTEKILDEYAVMDNRLNVVHLKIRGGAGTCQKCRTGIKHRRIHWFCGRR